jgi:hypothetical protein
MNCAVIDLVGSLFRHQVWADEALLEAVHGPKISTRIGTFDAA